MPPPMSDWFRSVPYGMDALAQAAKFQHESMAAEIRYYKSRSVRFESLIQRLKGEVAAVRAFKQDYEALKRENEQLCSGRAVPQEPGQAVNANGSGAWWTHECMATSSPRSIRTPLGPPRITLPPDHDPPPSFVKPGGTDGARSGQQVRTDRPGSSTFSKWVVSFHSSGSAYIFSVSDSLPSNLFPAFLTFMQYAYDPPQAAHMQMPQVLSHAQQAPTRQMQTQNDRRLMPPPPTPAYARQQQGLVQGRQMQRAATPRISVEANQGPSNPLAFGQQQQRVMRMPQPPAVRSSTQLHSQTPSSHFTVLEDDQNVYAQGQLQFIDQAPPHRFVPSLAPASAGPGRYFVPSTPTTASRRFVPSTPSMNATSSGHANRFVPSIGSHPAPGPTRG
ncbi:hypothetical protein DFH11DRAFT_1735879 [Phellopilus nigrolimitatus]|nr:hypothetical protein DFH11DRAFT_1735879 [Phellopilus nigrolimitatus]